MAKHEQKHGPLYEHAKRELELAGISGGKGNMDQKVFHTVLRLVDTFERSADSEMLADLIRNVFATLSAGEIMNAPTSDPGEWMPAPGLGENVMVLKRCNAFRTTDGGDTWFRPDTGASGLSKAPKEVQNANEETKKDVQPSKS